MFGDEKDDVPSTIVDAAPISSPLVKSAGRALQIFELFDEIQRAARVNEIADRLNWPQSSTSILLKCLVQLGYLDYQTTSRTFLPSARVALMGNWIDSGPIRDGRLIRMMEDLSHGIGDTIILAARNGIYSQFIHVTQARTAMRFIVPPGSRRLLVWSASGFNLLSAGSDDEALAICRRTNAEIDPHDRIDPQRMLGYVAQTRENGYFFSKGLVTPGAGSIAMLLPLGLDRGNRPMALAVSGILNSFLRREEEIVGLMRTAIERYLGDG